jgi:ferrochelatase
VLPLFFDWQLVYQSRSGPPSQPWLGPDIREHLRRLHASDPIADAVIAPIGFLAENMEVVYDLDVEVRDLCDELGINMVRTAVVGSHPHFVRMIRELVLERIDPSSPRLALGPAGPWPDRCPPDCCLQHR